MAEEFKAISLRDTEILRALAGELAGEAAKPIQAARRALWTRHNDLKTDQPLIFCDPENGWREIITEDKLQCEGESARSWEWQLRRQLFTAREMLDDVVIDAEFLVPYVVSDDGWGVAIQRVGGANNGAYHVKKAIEDYERDFEKVHYPRLSVDYPASARLLEEAQRVFDGLLRVRRYGWWWWSLGLTAQYIDLRGLEDFMCDMIEEPEWVHRMMDLLCRGTLEKIDWLEKEGLLFSNVGNRYVGSGGFGFTEQLPRRAEGETVHPKDMWGFVESQETVAVSPKMYGEFVFPYHKRIAERFGLNCFGCCEPYDARWVYARQLPNLRRVSCSPWSDRTTMRENLGMDYIASIKLNPSPLSRPHMDEDFVRAQLREAVENARGCVPELIMKDCHTISNNPNNPVRWVQIAREEIDRAFGA